MLLQVESSESIDRLGAYPRQRRSPKQVYTPTHPPGPLVHEMAALWCYCTDCTVKGQSVYSTFVHTATPETAPEKATQPASHQILKTTKSITFDLSLVLILPRHILCHYSHWTQFMVNIDQFSQIYLQTMGELEFTAWFSFQRNIFLPPLISNVL